MPLFMIVVESADAVGAPINSSTADRRFPEVVIEERSNVGGSFHLTCRAPSARHLERWLESIGVQASSIRREPLATDDGSR